MTTRTDIHRPSAIEPGDYYFVAIGYQKCEGLEDVYAIAHNRSLLEQHVERTGAKFSQHAHGGNCHVCGAHCIYTVIFHHVPTNTLIRTGFDCADKMDCHEAELFRTFRDEVKAAKHHKAGKMKAKVTLENAGLGRAWELYQLDEDPTTEPAKECWHCKRWEGCERCNYTGQQPNAYDTLCDIVSKLIKYGSISDGQTNFLVKLIDRVDNYERLKTEREAKQKAEHDAAANVPTGRTTITGEVISTRVQDSQYGTQYKMLVKDRRGFKVWGSIPSSLQLFDYTVTDEESGETWTQQRGLDRGDHVTFTATVEPSKDDEKFGFFKRPSKASLVAV